MKAILLGTDFMYNKKGKLLPIQINTALGHNMYDRVEDDQYVFDLTHLKNLIIKHDFKTIFYIGNIIPFKEKFLDLCNDLGKSLSFVKITPPSITVPLIRDSDEILIIRSAYDTSAIVDDSYCRNRANFLELIYEFDFGSEFAYVNSNGVLINNIKNIPKNGMFPNFILKSVFPDYDRNLYPKLFNLKTKKELKNLLNSLTYSYLLMPFYYNSKKLYNKHIINIRSLNILYTPELKSIPIGVYSKMTAQSIDHVKESDIYINRSPFLTTDDITEENLKKEYIKEKIIKDSEILIMNNIVTKIGNKFIKKYFS